jgi:hypothetical protein
MSLKSKIIFGGYGAILALSCVYNAWVPDKPAPGSKMKCNTLKCELEKRTQKGVADETVSTIKLGRKREDGSAKAIGVLYSGDCLSVRENAQHGLS